MQTTTERPAAMSGPSSAKAPRPAGSPARKPAQKTVEHQGGGLREWLIRIFGTELAMWGWRTGTLDPGLLGRKPVPDPLLLDRFPNLNEKQIIATSRAFKTALAKGWESLAPDRYNGIRYGFDFFLELVQLKPLYTGEPPVKWLQRTRNLQKSFAVFLAVPNGRDAITVDLPGIVDRFTEGPKILESARPVLHYLADLDSLRPTLRNVFIAFHGLTRGSLITWDSILADLAPEEANLRRYYPPPDFAADLYNHVHNTKDRFAKANGRIREINRIRQTYLAVDESGLVAGDLWREAFAAVSLLLPDDVRFADHTKGGQQAQLALFAMTKYMQTAFASMLGGTIKVRAEGSNLPREVILFRPEVMASMLDSLEKLVGAAERAVKTYRDGNMPLEAIELKSGEADTDPFRRYVRELATRSNKLLRNLTMAIEAVLSSHRATAERERQSKEVDQRNKELPIEELSRNARFLPHADATFAGGKLAGKKVIEAFELLLHFLYVGRYVFRDPDLITMLDSKGQLQKEAEDALAELQRMGEQTPA